MNMSKGDTELVLGSKMVYRRWSADRYGRLWGAYNRMWMPGLNTAQCYENHDRKKYNDEYQDMMKDESLDSYRARIRYRPTFTSMENCSCGFYGFYKPGSTDYKSAHPILGVAELTGEVVEGDKGVRGQKAEIKALVIPKISYIRKLNIRLANFFKAFGGLAVVLASFVAVLALVCLVAGVATLVSGSLSGLIFLAPVPVLIFVFVAAFISDEKLPNLGYAARVKRAYPQVEFFPTERAMLKKYPEVIPPTPTPDSDEFWKLPA